MRSEIFEERERDCCKSKRSALACSVAIEDEVAAVCCVFEE